MKKECSTKITAARDFSLDLHPNDLGPDPNQTSPHLTWTWKRRGQTYSSSARCNSKYCSYPPSYCFIILRNMRIKFIECLHKNSIRLQNGVYQNHSTFFSENQNLIF